MSGKENRLCFSCFESVDHQSLDCTCKKQCDMEGCGKYNHPLIHGAAPVFVGTPSGNSPPPFLPLNTAAPVFVGTSSVNCVPSAVLLQIDRTHSSCDPRRVKVSTFALLDSGSQTSLILENVTDTIGLFGEDSPSQLGTINLSGKSLCSRKLSLYVGATGGSEARAHIAVEESWTVPQLNLPQKVTRAMMQDFPHLTNLSIHEVNSEDVTVLLGANVLEAVLQHDVRRGRPGQPVAILTAFGWTLAGSVKSVVKPERTVS